jgi:hypothetical protein
MHDQALTHLDYLKSQFQQNNYVVEIGTDRIGGGSTNFLNTLAKAISCDFVTVDIDPIYLGPMIRKFTMSGEVFVDNFLPTILGEKEVVVACLDGFDWTDKPYLVRSGQAPVDTYNLIDEYRRKGLELNNLNAALSCTKIAHGLLPHLADQSAVFLGDTSWNYTSDTFVGKGVGAAYLLMSQGFTVLSASFNSPGILFGRNIAFESPMMTLDFDRLNKVYTGPGSRPDAILYKNQG